MSLSSSASSPTTAQPGAEVATLVLSSTSPATGEPVAQFAISTAEVIAERVAAARLAQQQWYAATGRQRAHELLAWKRLMYARRHELTDLLQRENGKVAADALTESTIMLHHLGWAARNSAKALATTKVRGGLTGINQSASLQYRPYGVVGVIGPWNYPVFTPMGSIAYALAAGNAVVFKPSEHTPALGQWLADTFLSATGRADLFVAVHGHGDVGAALCRSDVDKLAFTGSAPTGAKVMAACAESLTPVLMELGGKDAAIVADDAEIDSAATSILWGATMNAGQSCAGIERVYVVDAVAEEFLQAIAVKAAALAPGIDYGPMTIPSQIAVVERHITAAIDAGGTALVSAPRGNNPAFIPATVLIDVPEDNLAVTEETFGPTVTVARVPDIATAIARANDTTYALGAAVFSRHHGKAIADQLTAAMVSINDMIIYGSIPTLPFGGNKGSGFGRIHGVAGLREFATTRSITERRFRLPITVGRHDRSRVDLLGLRLTRWWAGRS